MENMNSIFDMEIVPELTLGKHTCQIIGAASGVTQTTADGKGGEAYITLTVRIDNEPFLRNSFTDASLFIKQGPGMQKFMRGASKQVGITGGKLSDLIAALKLKPIEVTVTANTSLTTGRVFQNWNWEKQAPVTKAEILDEELKLD